MTLRTLLIALIALLALLCLNAAPAAAEKTPWFGRILISNDDGIDNPRLMALVEAFAPHCEVWVVAPLENCSGSSNYCSAFSRRVMAVEPRDLGPGVRAWGVDGYPTDCVIFALTTLMKDTPPDLVLSGVNSSPNLSDAWLASGTIGVVRTAAHMGVPAVAFSGLREDAAMMEAVGDWAYRFCLSDEVRGLDGAAYLSVNIPRTSPDEIAGVRWAPPAAPTYFNWFEPDGEDESGRALWRLRWRRDNDRPIDTDQGLHNAGYITVTPLRVGEYDAEAGGDLVPWRQP